MRTARILPSLLIAYSTLLVNNSWVFAQNQPSTALSSQPEPESVVRQSCDFLKAQKAFTFEADITYDNVLRSGQKIQYSAYQKVWVQRPDHLRADYIGDQRDTRFYYNGKTFTWLNTDKDFYSTNPAPPTIDAVLQQIEARYGISLPLSNLVVSDPCSIVLPNVQDQIYVGMDMVNRIPSNHFLFVEKDKDWQLWVSDTAKPVPLKVTITYKNLPNSPQYTAVLSNWDFSPKVSETVFTFKPSAEAKAIDFLPVGKASDSSSK